MAKGYYLVQGDMTTCGGKIVDGASDHLLFGKAIARERDRVTCGQHPGMYMISGGIANDTVHGRKMAGTLDSTSTCPCRARFVPSMTQDTYETGGSSTSSSTASFDQNIVKQPNNIIDGSQFSNSDLSGMCFAKSIELSDGVFLWVETEGAGHAFVSIHIKNTIYVFTYGRYDQEGFSPVGEGVLIKYSAKMAESFYIKELYRMGASVYKVLDVDESSTLSIFNALWDSSNIHPDEKHTNSDIKEDGRVIDSYNLVVNNCTTTSVEGLKKAGTGIFDVKILGSLGYSEDFAIPSSLNNHLNNLASNPTDMRVMRMTDEFKDYYPNIPDYEEIEGAGSGNETAGLVGKGSGFSGEGSSGYAPTTFSHSQGGNND